MMGKEPATGEEIVSYCTKCKLDLDHTIVAMKEDKVARVVCRTCNGEHNYRDRSKKKATAAKKASTKKTTTPTKRRSSAKNPETLWKAALENTQRAEVPYNMSKAFKINDIILHKTFGKGVVLETAARKMTLIFEDKERKLVSSNH